MYTLPRSRVDWSLSWTDWLWFNFSTNVFLGFALLGGWIIPCPFKHGDGTRREYIRQSFIFFFREAWRLSQRPPRNRGRLASSRYAYLENRWHLLRGTNVNLHCGRAECGPPAVHALVARSTVWRLAIVTLYVGFPLFLSVHTFGYICWCMNYWIDALANYPKSPN